MGPDKRAGNLGVRNDELAGGEAVPQLAHEGAVVAVVEGAEHGADRVGGFFGVVEGDATFWERALAGIRTKRESGIQLERDFNLREQVVDDVVVDNVVEEVLANEAEVAVDGGESTLDESPRVGVEVVDLLVGVVEVGDGDCFASSVSADT